MRIQLGDSNITLEFPDGMSQEAMRKAIEASPEIKQLRQREIDYRSPAHAKALAASAKQTAGEAGQDLDPNIRKQLARRGVATTTHEQDILAATRAGNIAYMRPTPANQRAFAQAEQQRLAPGTQPSGNPLTDLLSMLSGANPKQVSEVIQKGQGARGEAARLIEGATDPVNISLMLTLPQASPFLQKLASAAFGLQLGHSAYEAAKDEKLKKTDPHAYWTRVIAYGILGAAASAHGATIVKEIPGLLKHIESKFGKPGTPPIEKASPIEAKASTALQSTRSLRSQQEASPQKESAPSSGKPPAAPARKAKAKAENPVKATVPATVEATQKAPGAQQESAGAKGGEVTTPAKTATSETLSRGRRSEPTAPENPAESHVRKEMGNARDRAIGQEGFSKARRAYVSWLAGRKPTSALKAEFAQHLYALAKTGRYNIELPSGNVKESDVFTVQSDDGRTLRIYGLNEVKPRTKPKPEGGKTDASQEVVQQEGRQPKHQGDDKGGTPTKPSGRSGPINAAQGVRQEQAQEVAKPTTEPKSKPAKKKAPTAAERRANAEANDAFQMSLPGKRVKSYTGSVDTVLEVKKVAEGPYGYEYKVRGEDGKIRTHRSPIEPRYVLPEDGAKAQTGPKGKPPPGTHGGFIDLGPFHSSVRKAMSEAREGLNEIRDSIRKVANPAARSPLAAQGARMLRHHNADLVRVGEIISKGLRPLKNEYEAKFTKEQMHAFQIAMDEGTEDTLPPELKAHAKIARDLLAQLRDEYLEAFRRFGVKEKDLPKLDIEHYWPRMFDDKPGLLRSRPSDREVGFGRRPLSGRKGQLKERTRDTLRESIEGPDADKELRYDNPWDVLIAHHMEVSKHIMAMDFLGELKQTKTDMTLLGNTKKTQLANFVRTKDLGKASLEGWGEVEDPLFEARRPIFQMNKQGEMKLQGRVPTGKWVVPKEVANVINNHLKPGLAGNVLYDAIRNSANTMTMARLSLSAFHMADVALNSVMSESARGLREMTDSPTLSGKARGALRTAFAHTPVLNLYSPLRDFVVGSRMLREYYAPGSQGAFIRSVVDALQKGGGRARMDANYRSSAIANLGKAIRTKNPVSFTVNAPMAILQSTGHLIMHEVVPRVKMGAFLQLAEMEMVKAREGGKTLSLDKQREIMASAWDSIDNRFGELVYDNTFMRRTLKDSAMLSMRAVGWNLGTVREIGGGVTDAATVLRRPSGERMTNRMAYTVSLVTVTAVYGAMLQKLMTGHGPKELKDYFFPRTGRILNPDKKYAQPERMELPTYMRDVAPPIVSEMQGGPFAMLRKAGEEGVNKLNPMPVGIWREWVNKDWNDKPLAGENLKVYDQFKQRLSNWVSNYIPIGLKPGREVGKPGSALYRASQAGLVTKAPQEINQPNLDYRSGYKTIRVRDRKHPAPP